MTEFITRSYGNKDFEIIIKTDSKEHYKATEDFARRLIDHAKPVTDNNVGCKWIPVAERLPEPETDVLTFCGGCIDIITYRYNRHGLACFMFRDDCGYWKETLGKITHWMPLPEPPKEE